MIRRTLLQHPVSWVALSLALVISPHLGRFPAWSLLLVLVLFAWRLAAIFKPTWIPPKWLLLVIMLLTGVGVFLHFGTLFGKTAGSVILSILLAIKLHESHSRRDYMLLISLSFFIIITNFLFSQSIPTVIFMLAICIVLVMSLFAINQENAPLPIAFKFKLASKMLLQAVPLMLVMFVLFPRISGPLWKLPEEQQTATTGLSDIMSPGNVAELIRSNAVAFRADFKDPVPEQNQLYWRAIVLWYFDGQDWEKGRRNLTPWTRIHSDAPDIRYTITLEPHQQYWLFALDVPVKVRSSIRYTNNFELRSREKISGLFQYQMKSKLEYIIQPELSPWERSAGLKIPPNTNLRTLAMGQQLARQYSNPADIVNHVILMFNQKDYHYTLKPPSTPGFDPVDQFLFDTRRGFCEHYASSFSLLMRAAGIPSRVILGYQGGTKNPLNNVITVRQSDAHAWSEVWLQGRGWVRIDPTAAIAPERIEQSLEAALDPQESRPLYMHINNSFLKDLVFYWDALDNQWSQWVIGYDEHLQQRLLDNLLQHRVALSEIIFLMVTGFTLVFVVIALFITKPWKKPSKDPIQDTYRLFCRKLARLGIQRMAHEGPMDFASRASNALPAYRDSIQLITQLYTRLRYQAQHSARQLSQFREHTRAFKPSSVGKETPQND